MARKRKMKVNRGTENMAGIWLLNPEAGRGLQKTAGIGGL
jgi:hypothetical protein